MSKLNHIIFQGLSLLLLITLIACGGSSKKNPTEEQLSWIPGTFEDEDLYKDFCEVPRSGTDLLGRAFTDKQGSTLHENFFLRSWSDNTYLWYDEITDQDPALTASAVDYFDLLKTHALTPSGNAKDNFHFTIDSADYLEQSQSGVSSGYGLKWAFIATSPPRDLRVAFSEPNGPAAAQGLFRGAEILEIDGVDLVNDNTQAGIDILNAGLSPSAAGETHTFLVRDLGASQTRTISLTSADVEAEAILTADVIPTNSGNVAYVMYNTFRAFSEEALVNTFNQLESDNITDLVLDLRYNGGGLLNLASELAYMIAGPTSTQGKIFEKTIFNDKHPTINPVTGSSLQPIPFYTETTGSGNLASGTQLPTLNLSRVFILSTGSTCSASEAVVNGLRGADVEVILIGDSTCGKPYGFYPTDNCGTTYFTIQLTGVNDKGFGEYPDGFTPENSTGTLGVTVPGCSVADDFSHALGDLDEGLLQQALDFRQTGTCSAPTINGLSSQAQKSQADNKDLSLAIPKELNERILSN